MLRLRTKCFHFCAQPCYYPERRLPAMIFGPCASPSSRLTPIRELQKARWILTRLCGNPSCSPATIPATIYGPSSRISMRVTFVRRQHTTILHASLARAVPIASLRPAGATGTALSITKQERVMSQSNLGSFQYMVDVGVPQEDVAWLQRIANTPGVHFTAAAARIRRIQDQAFHGLLAASVPVQQPVCQ